MKTQILSKENFLNWRFSLLLIFFISCSSNSQIDEEDETPDETEEPASTNYDTSSIVKMFDNIDAITYEVKNNSLVITTTNLPNHKSPYYKDTQWHNALYEDYNGTNSGFHLNPNRISTQNITFTISLQPASATNKSATPLGPIGISRNGVVFFNQYAAGNSALDNEIDSFDQYLGHPAGQGNYHYHIEPTFLTDTYGEDALLGLLADGFPVYGPKEGGETLSSSDLDDYHGHFGKTADFADGIYHYHVTADAPYINGDGFYGTKGNISQ